MIVWRLAAVFLAVFLLGGVPVALSGERAPATLTELTDLGRRLGYVRIPPLEGALVADERTEERLVTEMQAFFRETAPGIEKDAIGFRHLARGFARMLAATKGEMSESLFNERISRYNDKYVPLSAFLDSRKLPPPYVALLQESYGALLLATPQGDISLMKEIERIAAIPADCTLVTTRKGEYFREVVKQHYPGIEALADRQRARVYQFIAEMNPAFPCVSTKSYGEYETHEYRVVDGVALLPPPAFLDALGKP